MVSLVSIWDAPRYDDRLGVLTVVPADEDLQLVHTIDIITAMAGRSSSFQNHQLYGRALCKQLSAAHTCNCGKCMVDIRDGWDVRVVGWKG
eukprot:4063556-Pyramimonas_sp.AAC.1